MLRLRFLWSLLLALLFLAGPAQATEYLHWSKLKSGMKGYGLTVIEGTKIERFEVEIIDIDPNGGTDGGPLIIAEFSGPLIKKTGGIAQGFSGSPVYIGGKLIGAVSIAFPFSEGDIGGITPIHSMLRALMQPKGQGFDRPLIPPGDPRFKPRPQLPETSPGPISPGEMPRDGIEKGEPSPQPPSISPSPPGPGPDVRLTPPLFMGGISPSTLERVRPLLDDSLGPMATNLIPLGGAGISSKQVKLLRPVKAGGLRPGDAVVAQLVRGDLELYALGTVTDVRKDGSVLVFGHPFFNKGDVEIPFSKGYVVRTINSLAMSFKLGLPVGEELGTFTSDRLAAVAGWMGLKARMVPVSLEINDFDRGISEHYAFEVIRDRDMTPSLVTISILTKSLEFLDRLPKGTIHYRISFESKDLNEAVQIEDFSYDGSFAPFAVAAELNPILNLLYNNTFREVNIDRIAVVMDITKKRLNAAIEQVEVIGQQIGAAPGEGQIPTQQPPSTTPEQMPQPPASDEERSAFRLLANLYRYHPGLPDLVGERSYLQVPAPPTQKEGAQTSAQPQPPAAPVTVHPGEPFEIKVRLRPYRSDPIEQSIRITLPQDFPTGMTTVQVMSGSGLMSIGSEFYGKGEILFPTKMFSFLPPTPKSLDEILKVLERQQSNNELVIIIYRPLQPGEMYDPRKMELGAYRVAIPTDYVLYNIATLQLNITPSQQQKNQVEQGGKQTGPKQAGYFSPPWKGEGK